MICEKCGAEMRESGFIRREEPVTATTIEWKADHIYTVWRCPKCEATKETLEEVKV
jgi:hypothetical protein